MYSLEFSLIIIIIMIIIIITIIIIIMLLVKSFGEQLYFKSRLFNSQNYFLLNYIEFPK